MKKLILNSTIETKLYKNPFLYYCLTKFNITETLIEFFNNNQLWIDNLYSEDSVLAESCWNFALNIISADIYQYGESFIGSIDPERLNLSIGEYVYELLCIYIHEDDFHEFKGFFKSIKAENLIETLMCEGTYERKCHIIPYL